jgi:hypothetical protein
MNDRENKDVACLISNAITILTQHYANGYIHT